MPIRKTGAGEVLASTTEEPEQGIQVTSSQEQPWSPQDEQELAVESTQD